VSAVSYVDQSVVILYLRNCVISQESVHYWRIYCLLNELLLLAGIGLNLWLVSLAAAVVFAQMMSRPIIIYLNCWRY